MKLEAERRFDGKRVVRHGKEDWRGMMVRLGAKS
jgi:hypothetical protein